MPATYDFISTNTIGSNAATMSLSSIPSTYTDLALVFRVSRTMSTYVAIQFNGVTTGYSAARGWADNFGQGSDRGNSANSGWNGIYWSTPAFTGDQSSYGVIEIMNYSNTAIHTNVLIKDNRHNSTTYAGSGFAVGTWANTSVVNSISLVSYEGNFEAGSTMTLYGIKAA